MSPVAALQPSSLLPLSPAVFAILLALSDGEKHGYAIMKEAASQPGTKSMGPGTLYGSLDRMVTAGLIEETGLTDDERRRYYRITGFGKRVLAAEAGRMKQSLRELQRKGIVPVLAEAER